MADQLPVEVVLPGRETIRLKHVVLDFSGTLATHGRRDPQIREWLRTLTTQP